MATISRPFLFLRLWIIIETMTFNLRENWEWYTYTVLLFKRFAAVLFILFGKDYDFCHHMLLQKPSLLTKNISDLESGGKMSFEHELYEKLYIQKYPTRIISISNISIWLKCRLVLFRSIFKRKLTPSLPSAFLILVKYSSSSLKSSEEIL